jgi:hypothetical protein
MLNDDGETIIEKRDERAVHAGKARRRPASRAGHYEATLIEWNGVAGVRVTRIDELDATSRADAPRNRERCVGIVCEPMS